jgi:hypothetical protein
MNYREILNRVDRLVRLGRESLLAREAAQKSTDKRDEERARAIDVEYHAARDAFEVDLRNGKLK